ncbi:hypothetical protein [Winogradskyella sp. R77965]|uniref:hypothetical protein n=1 Tax=Winogradskyella sp. R77965 TaxID=3093872 RepID=UPI0037DDA9F7
MRNLLGLLLILGIATTSCEGRKSQNQALAESIEAFKEATIFEKVMYTPETYHEVVIDTLLSNGFRVKIKTYSDMNNSTLLEEFKKDTTIYKKFYREHLSDLEVYYNDSLVASKRINKSLFTNQKDLDFWKKAILGFVSINGLKSLKNELALNIYYCVPETDICKDFLIIYDKKGKYTLEELEAYELP